MNIPEDTKVYLHFGVRYIKVDDVVHCSILHRRWHKSKLQNMNKIIDHPNTRKVGTVGKPTKPYPPFEKTIITKL